jgi:O-succinylbenzoate synthase
VKQTPIPSLVELTQSARVVSLPLRNKFRGLTQREVLVFEGPQGWAEWAPFVEYPDEEAALWLTAAIEFGYSEFPELPRQKIPVNATLPAVAPDQVAAILARFGSFATVKIKVAESGQSKTEDIQRIKAVREIYSATKIRLDANGNLEVEQALELIRDLNSQGIELEYFEQPVATIAELAEVKLTLAKDQIPVKIAADESVRKVTDPLAVAQANAADILVLKAAPLGGINRSLEIAKDAGLPVVISSALDSSIGISMGAHLAALLPELNFDCGLGTATLLAGDVTRNPLLPVDGQIDVQRVDVDEEKLKIFQADDHRVDWWLDRLERVYKLL